MSSDTDTGPPAAPAAKNAVWNANEVKALFSGLGEAKVQQFMSGNGFRNQGWTLAVNAVAAANSEANPKKDRTSDNPFGG
ncbi:hypothetical protein R3P38DRAFT_3196412 [Favolaschia claudopus]|uniref:Uncharacterized protein n=1 Tax=Favolaschia claudopus TaxID=2862362 RepID=A0AAW0B833_9AGAR